MLRDCTARKEIEHRKSLLNALFVRDCRTKVDGRIFRRFELARIRNILPNSFIACVAYLLTKRVLTLAYA